MKKLILPAGVFFALLFSDKPSVAQSPAPVAHSPLALQTFNLRLTARGSTQIYAGFELRSDWQAPITRIRGELHRYGTLRVDWGLADNVSFHIRGAVRQILKANSATVARDAGDFSLATVVRVLAEKSHRPAFGFRVETKLPNTNQDRGIGNNTTDIAMAILSTKQFGPALVFSDLGLVIMSAPKQINDQNDALVYGLGTSWSLSKSLQLAGEINGFTSPRDQIPLGTEDRSAARAGVSWKFSKLALEVMAAKGLTRREGDWGFTAGFSTQFPARKSEK